MVVGLRFAILVVWVCVLGWWLCGGCELVVVRWPWVFWFGGHGFRGSVAMCFGGWFLSPFSAVVADKMGCGGFGFAGVGMVVVGLGLGLPAWVWGLWVVAVVEA